MSAFSPLVAITIFFLLVIEGFFSGSELALLSADRLNLKKRSKQGESGAGRALRLLKAPDRILSTTLIMTSLCVMSISVLLTLEFRRIYGEHGEIRAVICGSALVIVFGELLPKFFYRKFSALLVPKLAKPIFYTQKILSPFIHLTSLYTSQIAKIMEPIEVLWSGRRSTAKDELQGLLTSDSEDTQIKSDEKNLIRKILKFRDKIAKDGFVQLVQVDAIERQSTLLEAFELFHRKKHSRLPVYDERIDNVIGILELSQIIRQTDLTQRIDRFIKPAIYVPENQKLEPILHEMIERDYQIAIVVDEYGGAVGILTREDIFEQIVGDIEDEDDPEKKLIREVSSGRWVVKARTTITELNEQLHLELPEGDYDTIGGFLLRQFSRIPEPGDELFFDTREAQLHFTVRDSSRRRIESVSIERIKTES
ncbi:MAG: HlyC/CorC family transporter [Proteobacteria bacterium]|nr:HlyC/CorC family transporter [Pseudomonadota bacterium]